MSPVITVISPTVQTITLVVVSVRVITRNKMTLSAYAVAETKAARAPSVTRLEADGFNMTTTPTSPTEMAIQTGSFG